MSNAEQINSVLSAWCQSLVEWTAASCGTASASTSDISQNCPSSPVHFDVGTKVLLRVDVSEEHSAAYTTLLGTALNAAESVPSERFLPAEGYSQIRDVDDDDDIEQTFNDQNEHRGENVHKSARILFLPATIVEHQWRNTVST